MGLERQADAQLFQEGEVGVGGEGGLEVQRDEAAVWEAVVVDLILCCLLVSAGKQLEPFCYFSFA